ncbi:MAG: hypothetical protein GX811_08575 [Lentisphaerae bacterium]|nr:hypothetical protein [Lentisphaerota bacterium]
MTKINVLKDIPYSDTGMGRRKLKDEKHLQVMQAALKPGQEVPAHKANSNVHLLILEGELNLNLDGQVTLAVKGDLVQVAYDTYMLIKNLSSENTSFLILKTPNPAEFGSV